MLLLLLLLLLACMTSGLTTFASDAVPCPPLHLLYLETSISCRLACFRSLGSSCMISKAVDYSTTTANS